jgi:DNA-binding NarL/FixJ family response regulator
MVGIASNGVEARKIIGDNITDVYLVDLGLPDIDGVELIALIKETCHDAQSLVISTFGDSKHIISSIRAGASGYLLKEDFGHDLIEKIVSLRNGSSLISPSLVKHIFSKVAKTNDQKPKLNEIDQFEKFGLAARENDVFKLLVNGLAVYNIAAELGISIHTVNQHLRSIYRKLNVHSRAMAVHVAIKNEYKN